MHSTIWPNSCHSCFGDHLGHCPPTSLPIISFVCRSFAGKMIKRTLTQQFPKMGLFKAGYKVRNHTGNIQQLGATCGPWSLWIAPCINPMHMP